jgi:endonuclease/exonuclease/phosphatase family metal-dependent hydrolase
MVADIMAKGADMPTILLGDLNEWRLGDRSSLSTFRSTFGAQAPSVPSFPANMPILALDRIIANRGGMISAIEVHNSPLARIASDHLPIKTMLTLDAASSA